MRGGIPKLSLFCFLFFLLCIIILFVCFILCFALLCFYVSLHYVLPALQCICACLIFMNMYVLLVAVCKCIVCFYVIFIYVGSKAHCELMLYCLCLADFLVFNATFNNISVISWWSVLLVEETAGPGENHRPVASH